MMKILLLILLSGCVYISADISGPPQWDEVTVTFGKWTNVRNTQAEAMEQGWTLLQDDCPPENKISPFVGKRFVGKDGDQTIILIFGANGYLAGIQFSYVKHDNKADGDARILYDGRTYVTAYFTDTSKVCDADASTTAGIIGKKLILLAEKGKEMEIPRKKTSIGSESGWKEGLCFNRMGTHWWYNYKKKSICDELFPIYPLFDKTGNLIAFGFNYFYKVESSWVENIPTRLMRYFMKTVPECLSKSTHLITTIHVYLSSDKARRLC